MSKRHFINCYGVTGELEYFPVPEEVYYYIRQLEAYIIAPEVSQLKKEHAYKFRFGEKDE